MDDPDRSVYYGAFTLKSCIVEVFGDAGTIERGTFRVVNVRVAQALQLLDLRGDAAMRAGLMHAIGQIEDRRKTQAWSRYIYENPEIFGAVDGLLYANSHNGEDAVMLYERAQRIISTSSRRISKLSSPGLEAALLSISDDTGLPLL